VISDFSKIFMGHDLTDIFSSTQGMDHFVSPSKKMVTENFSGMSQPFC